MNAVTKFNHEQFGEIRITDQGGEPWFMAKDVCSSLGFNNPSDATKYLDDEDRTLITNPSGKGGSKTTIINESGLYSLILRSRKPEAKVFKKWVTSEVLPAIRKTGGYSVPTTLDELPSHLETAKLLVTALEENETLKIENKEMEPKAEFYDVVTASDSVCSMAEAAQVGELGFGQNILFRKLRTDSVLISGGVRHNHPKQKYIEQGLFTLEERNYIDGNDQPKVSFKTHVTQKGIDWLIRNYRQPRFELVS